MPSLAHSEALEALGAELLEDDEHPNLNEAPQRKSVKLWDEGWRPFLNPTQKKGRDSKAIFKLYHGERGSGKTICGLHEAVEALFLNNNYLAFVIVKELGQATDGGAWHKLMHEVLPVWKHGNRDPDGAVIDEGIDLEYSEQRYDPNTKKPYIWIANRFGGYSMITLISLPVDKQVSKKVKGKEPGFILVDEAQTLLTMDYFKSIVQQLGRRRGMQTRSKIIFCANPEGPSHWLYQKFFIQPVNTETGEWDKRFLQLHIPVQENKFLPADYYTDYVIPAVQGDEIEEARMVRGEWVERPTGLAMFRDDFSEQLHVVGDQHTNEGIIPLVDVPVIVSSDFGAAHTSIHMIQVVPTAEKIHKIIFDEMNYVGQYMPYRKLVPQLIERMLYWEKLVEAELSWIHVSDDSAFNQYRAKDGSFDAWDVEQISREYVEKHELDERFIIRLRPAPKGPHSVEARVRMLRDDLQYEETVISATCLKTKEMLQKLEEDPDERMKPKRSPFIHPFDSMTYGLFWAKVGKGRVALTTRKIKPQSYNAGSN